MRNLLKFIERLAADSLRGGSGIEKFGVFLLQTQKLGIHHVVIVVGDLRIVIDVVPLRVI